MKAIPTIDNKDGVWKLTADGRPMILLAGEVHNSSSSSLSYMEQVWEQGKKLGMNCLLLPITWELLEPEEGNFDFSLVDGLIMQARQHEMKISFLWFGTWKNAQSTYAPEWVKKDTKRFKRAQLEKGKSFVRVKRFYNLAYSPLSYLCQETYPSYHVKSPGVFSSETLASFSCYKNINNYNIEFICFWTPHTFLKM